MQDSDAETDEAAASRADAASPCIGVCRLNADQFCVGCGRHIVEITAAGVAAARERARSQES